MALALLPGGAPQPAQVTDLALPEAVLAWSRPKRVGQVVRHFKTSRHGLVEAVDHATGRMLLRFPDTLKTETRWQSAFYETNVFCPPSAAATIFDNGGGQGIWWQDDKGVVYVMANGMTMTPPAQVPLRTSQRPRSATPRTRRA